MGLDARKSLGIQAHKLANFLLDLGVQKKENANTSKQETEKQNQTFASSLCQDESTEHHCEVK